MAAILTAIQGMLERPGFAGLSDSDYEELGFTRTQVALLTAIHPGAHERMAAMAARFGLTLDEVLADPDRAAAATACCGDCSEATRCRAAAVGAVSFPDATCPNAEIYLKLAADEG